MRGGPSAGVRGPCLPVGKGCERGSALTLRGPAGPLPPGGTARPGTSRRPARPPAGSCGCGLAAGPGWPRRAPLRGWGLLFLLSGRDPKPDSAAALLRREWPGRDGSDDLQIASCFSCTFPESAVCMRRDFLPSDRLAFIFKAHFVSATEPERRSGSDLSERRCLLSRGTSCRLLIWLFCLPGYAGGWLQGGHGFLLAPALVPQVAIPAERGLRLPAAPFTKHLVAGAKLLCLPRASLRMEAESSPR